MEGSLEGLEKEEIISKSKKIGKKSQSIFWRSGAPRQGLFY
jgi:hypothetical protein